MKKKGIPEFGPAPGKGTVWVIETKQGATMRSVGVTAFEACERVGLTLGQVADIRTSNA